jgi:biotin-(acetyl-CoA carboxylase) ligase
MKLKIVISMCVFALCCCSFAYSQDNTDETQASVWITEHQTEIQSMSREDWLQLDESLKRPVFMKFTQKQRYEFWLHKIQETLALPWWNELEKNHIQLLYQTIYEHFDWFELTPLSEHKAEYEEYESVTRKWAEYAQDTLGWDKNLIGAIAATGNKVLNKKGEIEEIQKGEVFETIR